MRGLEHVDTGGILSRHQLLAILEQCINQGKQFGAMIQHHPPLLHMLKAIMIQRHRPLLQTLKAMIQYHHPLPQTLIKSVSIWAP